MSADTTWSSDTIYITTDPAATYTGTSASVSTNHLRLYQKLAIMRNLIPTLSKDELEELQVSIDERLKAF